VTETLSFVHLARIPEAAASRPVGVVGDKVDS
jgi:hypothetical protein